MKKLILLIAILLPLTASAVWWNPATWFETEPQAIRLGLATTTSQQTIIPFLDNSYDLGTTTKAWRNIFMYNSAGATRCLQITSTGLIQIASAACGSGSGSGSGGGTWATTTITGSVSYFNYSLNATDVVGIGSISGTSTAKFWFDPNLSTSWLNRASTTLFSANTGYFNFLNATATNATSTFSGGVKITGLTKGLVIASSTGELVGGAGNIRIASNFAGGDCGAKINNASTDIGAGAGEIWVDQSCGTTWTSTTTLTATQVLRFTQGGTYTISAAINGGHIQGSGFGAPHTSGNAPTIIKQGASANMVYMIKMSTANGSIRDVEIDGNEANNTGTTTGVYITGRSVLLEDVYIHDNDTHGVWVRSATDTGNEAGVPKFFHVISYSNSGDGFRIENTTDAVFEKFTEAEGNTGNGILLANGAGARIIGVDMAQNTGAGLYLTGTSTGLTSRFVMIEDNQFGNGFGHDIYINGHDAGGYISLGNNITGNTFYGGDNRTSATYDAIHIKDSYANTITSNVFDSPTANTYAYGINFEDTGSTSYDSITANTFNGTYATAEILDKAGGTFTVGNSAGDTYLQGQTAIASSLILGGYVAQSNRPLFQYNSGATTAGVTGTLYGFGESGVAWLGQFDTSGNFGIQGGMNTVGKIGVSTSTPQWTLNPFSSSALQLSLSAGAGLAQWGLRNAGGNLYLSTTTVAGTATTSISALEIAGDGFGTTTIRGLNISGQATSTSNVGFNITTGCYAISNSCIGGGGQGSGTVNTGTAGYFAYYPSDGTTVDDQTSLFLSGSNIGIATTTPAWQLQIATTSSNGGFRPQLTLTDMTGPTDGKHWGLYSLGGNFHIGTSSDSTYATSAPIFTIATSSRVGIGTANPAGTLHIADNGALARPSIMIGTRSAGGPAAGLLYNNTNNTLETVINATKILELGPTGTLTYSPTNFGFTLQSSYGSTGVGAAITLNNAGSSQRTPTLSNTYQHTLLDATTTFAPTSGGSIFNELEIRGMAINQTGSARGSTTGIYIKPTLTAARDFRAIETAPYTFNLAVSTTTLQGILQNAYTIASTSAATVTNAYGHRITGAPIASTNVTISTSTGLMIDGESVAGGGTVTNAYGLQVFAPQGATNNYAASFMNGNVGIGTSTPWRTFGINGTGAWDGLTAAGATNNSVCIVAAGKEIQENAASSCLVSTRAGKKNINELTVSALDLVNEMQAFSYNYKEDPTNREWWGFMAEDMAEIAPQFVSFDKEGKPHSIEPAPILSVVVKAIQELEQKGIQAKRSAEENWQTYGLIIAFLFIGIQQYQIRRLKK